MSGTLSGTWLNISGTAGTSATQMSFNQWSAPQFIKTIEYDDSLEFLYRQYSMAYRNWDRKTEERVFKIIYSCIDGKWNKSEPIYGTIIPAVEEDYEFED